MAYGVDTSEIVPEEFNFEIRGSHSGDCEGFCFLELGVMYSEIYRRFRRTNGLIFYGGMESARFCYKLVSLPDVASKNVVTVLVLVACIF